jgi:hypothetical protein
MGTLVVMCYPTKLFANLADHTYVACGTGGMAWSCWGGKTGGTELRRADGSTNRANAIAGANERAAIKCYLINGVCHQAANRILFPASITVRGARGYDVSESLFGTYGRPTGPFGTCRSPFDQQPGVTGDLPACIETPPTQAAAKRASKAAKAPKPPASRAMRAARAAATLTPAQASQERAYLRRVVGLYDKADKRTAAASASAARSKAPDRGMAGSDLERFQLELFMNKARYHLGSAMDKSMAGKLQDIRLSAGRSMMKVEDWFTNDEMSVAEFVKAFNKETLQFQETAANALKAPHYKALFGLKPGDFVVLADPRIVKRAFAKL